MSKRRCLSLSEKIEVISVWKKEKLSNRDLAARFEVGKTQINEILKKRNLIILQLKGAVSKIPAQTPVGHQLDETLYNCICQLSGANVEITKELIREKALKVARDFNIENLKITNSCIDDFLTRHEICLGKLTSEDCDFCGYKPEDVFSIGEFGLFFRAQPDDCSHLEMSPCVDGEFADQRLTIVLCMNMEGKFEEPLVVCSKSLIDFNWKTNPNSWMTQEIMVEWLQLFDQKMNNQQRQVIVFLGNLENYNGINLESITLADASEYTYHRRSMTEDIIPNFKILYRKQLLEKFNSKRNICLSDANFLIQWSLKYISDTYCNSFLKLNLTEGMHPVADSNVIKFSKIDDFLKTRAPNVLSMKIETTKDYSSKSVTSEVISKDQVSNMIKKLKNFCLNFDDTEGLLMISQFQNHFEEKFISSQKHF